MDRVLVTGAGGFIGRHLVSRLFESGHSVTALVRKETAARIFPEGVLVADGDIRDASRMQQYARSCDTVFHLAACLDDSSRSRDLEAEYISVNVEGTRNVLDGAIKGGAKRFVFFSSVKAMGEETEGCADESSPPLPRSPYGRSKLQAERLVMDCGREHNLHSVCLRLPMVYGEGSRGNLTKMIAAIDSGFFPAPPKTVQRRSIVHVKNVVDAAMLAVSNPSARGQYYIVTDERAYSTLELYEIIRNTLGRRTSPVRMPLTLLRTIGYLGDVLGRLPIGRVPFNSETVRKLTASAWYSSEKIERELGFTPSISFEQALPGLIEWCRGCGRDRAC